MHAAIDFETRSACDLPETGAEVYARHPTTDALCLAYAFGDGEVLLWVRGQPLPDDLRQHIEAGGRAYAQNAPFELAIWNNVMVPRYGWPPLNPAQVRCTQAMAYAMGLPGSLDGSSRALGITDGKDMAGHRLMLQLSKPRRIEPDGTIVWWEDADKLERLYAYCRQDVVVERDVHKRMVELSADEQDVWLLDYTINQRGIGIDIPGVEAALRMVDAEKARLDAAMKLTTNGAVAACSEVGKLTEWVRSRGVEVDGLAKADIADLLAQPALPADVVKALQLRREAGKSSTAKLSKMLACACPDGRVRGALQYHGAQPGRWAGRLIQIQNYPRPPKYLEDGGVQLEVIDRIIDTEDPGLIDLFYGPPMDVLSGVLRGFLVPAPGNEFIAVDYSNIEGRVLAWLAGEEWKLEAFREQDRGGAEIYLVAAGRIYGVDPATYTKKSPERQIGKVSELALGYQGGVGAFQTMAKTYGVKVPDDQADRIKTAWREAHPATVRYWYDLEEAAINATLNPGVVYAAGPAGRQVRYRKSGSFLWCRLPSGRVTCYPYPEVRTIETPWGASKDALTYMFVPNEADKRRGKLLDDPRSNSRWMRGATYGGSLAENVTQGSSACLLRAGLRNCEAGGYPIVFHVHDELVAEVPKGTGSVDEMAALMTTLPAWAAGLPVAAEGFRASRYRK